MPHAYRRLRDIRIEAGAGVRPAQPGHIFLESGTERSIQKESLTNTFYFIAAI
jgi:hypothetical protein